MWGFSANQIQTQGGLTFVHHGFQHPEGYFLTFATIKMLRLNERDCNQFVL